MKSTTRTTGHSGFSLVEVVLALGIASFCLIGLLALLPAGLSSNKDAIQKTIASGFAAEVAADLRNTPAALQSTGTSQRFQFIIPRDGGDNTMTENPQTIYVTESGSAGQIGAAPTTESRYRISVGFAPPSSSRHDATLVRILVTWPAQANPIPTTWPVGNSGGAGGSYEIITALDRN
jgi:uncharacterized protein (TIGR02598 family)